MEQKFRSMATLKFVTHNEDKTKFHGRMSMLLKFKSFRNIFYFEIYFKPKTKRDSSKEKSIITNFLITLTDTKYKSH